MNGWIVGSDESQVLSTLYESPEDFAEEYAIHDFEGFGGYRLSEYEGIESTHNVACFIEEYPEIGGELLDHMCDIDEARKAAEDNYCGCYKSMADYAEELTEETTQIPESLTYYIDYEKMGRDMKLSGDVFTIETGYEEVHMF
ncbi:putative antirestriction protein [hydrothermal vent metagenome]|uniref:Putative antirestriction protein n=1 Tax=hydrothermal vent metagenome TaxID=652676 RepID=A0A3B1DV48_9ZZZZ